MASMSDIWEFNSQSENLETIDAGFGFISALKYLSKILTIFGGPPKREFLRQMDGMTDSDIKKILHDFSPAAIAILIKQIEEIEKKLPQNEYVQRLKTIASTAN
ncbi:hypothetical protein KKB43_05835 [Patescibacteria group bacterium]|nr:hypothetical protein [Patescibacteria group bacterium]